MTDDNEVFDFEEYADQLQLEAMEAAKAQGRFDDTETVALCDFIDQHGRTDPSALANVLNALHQAPKRQIDPVADRRLWNELALFQTVYLQSRHNNQAELAELRKRYPEPVREASPRDLLLEQLQRVKRREKAHSRTPFERRFRRRRKELEAQLQQMDAETGHAAADAGDAVADAGPQPDAETEHAAADAGDAVADAGTGSQPDADAKKSRQSKPRKS